MYSKVLVPVSLAEERNSEAAFAMARHLAGPDGEVCALHVVESAPNFSEAYVPAAVTEQLTLAAKAEFDKVVPDDVKKRDLLHGAAGVTILGHAEKIGADCIVVASHRPGLSDYFLGSTAARVVRHATCAVHVIR